jgi:hypothetical protein
MRAASANLAEVAEGLNTSAVSLKKAQPASLQANPPRQLPLAKG